MMYVRVALVFVCVSVRPLSTGDGQATESSASLRLPPCASAVGLRQRPDGHEKGVLRQRLQKSGGLPQREVRRDVQSCAFLCLTDSYVS